jgi:N-acetylmuramoyl-L-alanine amidase
LRVGEHVWPLRIGHLNPMDETPDEGVSGIQARLRNLGYDVGPIDHRLGRRTRAAIRAFQRDNPPLVVDGICGPKTRAKLIEKHGC